jgi:nucleoside-diphosphate-sugar epimerase
MQKILITGATGFIGRHCVRLLLEKGYDVHAVSTHTHSSKESKAQWHRADLLESGAVFELMERVQPDALLHLAWYAVPGKYWTSTENFRWVRASLDLFQSFQEQGGRRIVVAGSCAEYDWSGDGVCSETKTPLRPATLYGSCKHALRIMLEAFAKQSNLSVAWGRIFFLYGEHEYPSRLVASVIRSLLQVV